MHPKSTQQFYEHLSSFSKEDEIAKRKEIEKVLSGFVYHGYKGGEYTYTEENTLHVDNYGRYTETEIVKVEVTSYCVYLHTAREEF